jgi:hypothetical protein
MNSSVDFFLKITISEIKKQNNTGNFLNQGVASRFETGLNPILISFVDVDPDWEFGSSQNKS